ncbi:NAD(P)/FAD-dependent oxidoreductase [Nocardiopsis alba]|uniref:NAD(P)/FAD-dependent oxidoreductase n=1 Tax=Nocardiopsis alba TaxID=53437 RepID=UPI001F31A354|nr:NAD(P)/FAD-dependent oxidoreductase [Nocardiopsis alba]
MTESAKSGAGEREPTAVRHRAETWLHAFEEALTERDTARATGMFAPTCYWRDLVAFTWNLKTVEGHEEVETMLRSVLDSADPSGFHLTEEPTETDGVIEAWIAFETAVGRGRGHLRLRDEGAFTLLTTLYELKGHEEPEGERRPMGAEHGARRDRVTWAERREAVLEGMGRSHQPYVVVVGGGQGGIALGARLTRLGVPYLVIDRHERPGDQWRGRYKSLCLHDPVWYDHLPYLDFPRNWPVFAPKDKIADWLEMYTKVMEVDYWSSTTCLSAKHDEETGEWTVVVDRAGEEIVLRPRHLVLATGMSGKPVVPELPGRDRFLGDQHHSSRHPGPDAYRGRRPS